MDPQVLIVEFGCEIVSEVVEAEMGSLCQPVVPSDVDNNVNVARQSSKSTNKSRENSNQITESANIVVIWDFDKSLINDDSDFYLFKKFGIDHEIRDGLSKQESHHEKHDKRHSLDRFSFMNFMNNSAYPRLFAPRDSVRANNIAPSINVEHEFKAELQQLEETEAIGADEQTIADATHPIQGMSAVTIAKAKQSSNTGLVCVKKLNFLFAF